MANIIKYFLIFTLFATAALLVGPYFFNQDFSVLYHGKVEHPCKNTLNYVQELKNWPNWTTWNHDSEDFLTYKYSKISNGIGAKQRWKSASAGNGSIEITSILKQPNTDQKNRTTLTYILEQELVMKSKGQIVFTAANDDGTSCAIEWSLGGQLDYFYRPMGRVLTQQFQTEFGKSIQLLSKLLNKKSKK